MVFSCALVLILKPNTFCSSSIWFYFLVGYKTRFHCILDPLVGQCLEDTETMVSLTSRSKEELDLTQLLQHLSIQLKSTFSWTIDET